MSSNKKIIPSPPPDSYQPTLGEKALELLEEDAPDYDPREVIEATDKEFEETMGDIIAKHKDYAPHYFIEVKFLQENFHRRTLYNIFHRKFIVRKTPCAPQYDTSLYSFDNAASELFLHWTIPSVEGCLLIKANEKELNPEEKWVFECVDKWVKGKLEKETNLFLKNKGFLLS